MEGSCGCEVLFAKGACLKCGWRAWLASEAVLDFCEEGVGDLVFWRVVQ